MSAAQAVLVETTPYLESMPSASSPEDDMVRDLIHELRQPLSSIEAIAYYLEMTLPPEQIQARLYMRRLQQLVDQTSCILQDATAQLRKEVAGVA
jgi:nitrogen-specific signal transduction histidine kinase